MICPIERGECGAELKANEGAFCDECLSKARARIETRAKRPIEALKEIGEMLDAALEIIYGRKMGFGFLIFDLGKAGRSDYLSNGNREDMIEALREAADRIENGETFARNVGDQSRRSIMQDDYIVVRETLGTSFLGLVRHTRDRVFRRDQVKITISDITASCSAADPMPVIVEDRKTGELTVGELHVNAIDGDF